jgi:hypothetical protein
MAEFAPAIMGAIVPRGTAHSTRLLGEIFRALSRAKRDRFRRVGRFAVTRRPVARIAPTTRAMPVFSAI